MNILFCCEIDWIHKPVIDMHLLAEGLSLMGHRVYAVDYENDWGKSNGVAHELNVSRALPYSSVHLIRPTFIKIPVVSRMSAFISHYIAIEQVISDFEIDAIVLYSVPTNGLQSVYLAHKHDIPVIFRSIDILNELVHYKPLKRITKYLEGKVYSKVDRVLTLTSKLSEYVMGLGANSIRVLPMATDTTNFYPYNDNAMRHMWGISDNDKLILSIGTLYYFSGLDLFIPHMKRIIDEVPNAKLLIVGDGKQREQLESIIKEHNLSSKVIITGWQPYKDIPRYINTSDVCVHPFIDCEATRDIFPGKVSQIMACGKPVVATPLSGIRSMLPSKNEGIAYGRSIDDMVDIITTLLKHPEISSDIGNNGLQCVRQTYDYKIVSQQLESEIKELIG